MSDIDNLRKSIDSLAKIVNRGFIAVNENLTDIGLSLRRICKEDQKDDSWHPVMCKEDEELSKYDWVLVKIRDIGGDGKVHDVPHIAQHRDDGCWWALEWDNYYGSDHVPFEVAYWKPISGDTIRELFVGGEIVWRAHTYE